MSHVRTLVLGVGCKSKTLVIIIHRNENIMVITDNTANILMKN